MDGAGGGGHLDEGTIHAWLDDALDAERAARVASHVESCPDCAAAVAEARGLIAGASRVVRALDEDSGSPAGGPDWGRAPLAGGTGSLWRLLRVTPARAAIAATLLVALGVTLTYPRGGLKEIARMESGVSTTAAPAAPLLARDSLLDSAVRRNIAAAQPPRALEAAPGPAIPRAPGPGENATSVDATAPARVAEGRAAVQRMRESSAPAADRTATYSTIPAAKEPAAAPSVAMAAPAAQARDSADQRVAGAPECYRLESETPGAEWGSVPLPFVVALQPTSGGGERGGALIIDPRSGSRSAVSALWSRRAGDTLQLDLRRLGYTGQILLGAGEEARTGTIRSAPTQSRLEAVMVTGAAGPDESAAATADRAAAKRAVRRPVRRAAPAAVALADSAPRLEVVHAMPVAARRVSCP